MTRSLLHDTGEDQTPPLLRARLLPANAGLTGNVDDSHFLDRYWDKRGA